MEVTEEGGLTRFPVIKQDCSNAKKIIETFDRYWDSEDKLKPYIPQILKREFPAKAKILGLIVIQQQDELNSYLQECISSNCLEDCDFRKHVRIFRKGHRSKRQEKRVEEELRNRFK